MMEDFFFKRKGRKYFVLTLGVYAKGLVQMDITHVIGRPFQIEFFEIHSLRLASVKSTLNSTGGQLCWKLVSPVEKNAFEVRMFGNYFLHKCGDLVQLRDIQDFGGNHALVFVCEPIEMFLSTSDCNDMRSCLRIPLRECKTDA